MGEISGVAFYATDVIVRTISRLMPCLCRMMNTHKMNNSFRKANFFFCLFLFSFCSNAQNNEMTCKECKDGHWYDYGSTLPTKLLFELHQRDNNNTFWDCYLSIWIGRVWDDHDKAFLTDSIEIVFDFAGIKAPFKDEQKAIKIVFAYWSSYVKQVEHTYYFYKTVSHYPDSPCRLSQRYVLKMSRKDLVNLLRNDFSTIFLDDRKTIFLNGNHIHTLKTWASCFNVCSE
jgi:hypothetical protein